MTNSLRTCMLGALLALPMTVFAAPPIWDADFGPDTGLYADDDLVEATLGFMFPIDGVDYDTIAISSNGGVTFGVAGVFAGDPFVWYDVWNVDWFELEFTFLGNPAIMAFQSDLSTADVGTINFKTDATTAVVTWSEIAAAANAASPLISFQMTLASDGTITLGYDGITGDVGSEMTEGIVVGVSNGAGDPPPASSDLGAAVSADLMTSTVYEIWCWNEDMMVGGTCFDQTGTRSDNYGFDLDQTNVIFTPNGTGGYDLSAQGTAVPPPKPVPPPPPPPPVLDPEPRTPYKSNGCTVGMADGTIDPTLPLLVLISLGYLLHRRKREI